MSKEQETSPKKPFWRMDLPLESETCFFIFANCLDALMTKFLLNFPQFRESNGVANYVLQKWGMPGMICYKFVIVAGVVVIAQIIAQRNIKVAKRLLIFGAIFFFAVAFYSAYLYRMYGGNS